MSGCSAPYCEAIQRALEDKGLPIGPEAGLDIVMIRCDGDDRWDELCCRAEQTGTLAVAVLPTLVLDDYVKALALGAAGVVYEDTTSAITAEVVEAAIQGEVLLPTQAAHGMAMLARRSKPTAELEPEEVDLLQAVASGRTIVDLARDTYYSERTVRRHLQSLYLKLGVRNRAEAIAAATRMGICDTP